MNAQRVADRPVAVMAATEWRARAAAHAARIDGYVAPHLARRETGAKHPVFDFLFTYYSHRPAHLRRWHPGYGVALVDAADEYGSLKGYAPLVEGVAQRPAPPEVEEVAQRPAPPEVEEVTQRPAPPEVGGVAQRPAPPEVEEVAQRPSRDPLTVTPAYVASQRPLLEALRRLLTATATRAPHFGCFGLHEWAMVYRLSEDQTRHADWPLRLGAQGTDEVVEGHRIACSHFDAYRFFTGPARPLNTLSPGRDDRPAFEQPACLHAGMDLYKHAFRLSPMICSDLVADAFELAWDIRVVDMRAAPYDLSGVDLDGEPWTPIRIETPEGKREYADVQRQLSERAAPVRAALIAECQRLLGLAA